MIDIYMYLQVSVYEQKTKQKKNQEVHTYITTLTERISFRNVLQLNMFT